MIPLLMFLPKTILDNVAFAFFFFWKKVERERYRPTVKHVSSQFVKKKEQDMLYCEN